MFKIKLEFSAPSQSAQPGNDHNCHCEEPPLKGRRRGNLLVQPNNLQSRIVRRIAPKMPSILVISQLALYQEIATSASPPRNDTVILARLHQFEQNDKLQLEYKKGGQCPPLAVYQFARLSYRFSLLPQRQMLWLSRRITKVS